MTITEYLERQRKGVLVLSGIMLLVLTAAGDYLTHARQALEFSAFYLVPISFFSWFLGKQLGILLAIVSLSLAFAIRLAHVQPVIRYLNAVVWVALYVGSVLMISQLKRLYERERHLSRIDPLTKIENRRALMEALARSQSSSERYHQPLSISYLDVDGFKELNDRFGHSTGDKILVSTADVMRRVLRPTDTVARIGGDEFATVLPGSGRDAAIGIIDRLRFELRRATEADPWAVTYR